MKIQESTTRKLLLTEVKALDPITVFLEDLEPRKGKITINCWDSSWSAYWGGMGKNSIAEFFISCNNSYLIGNLSRVNANIDDYDHLDVWLKSEIIKLRKDRDIDKDEAAELWSDIEINCQNCEHWIKSESGNKLCHKVIGDDWWHSIPSISNPEYLYLERIVDAVRDALKQTLISKAA